MQAEHIVEWRFRCTFRFVSLCPCFCNSARPLRAADYQAAKDLYDQGEIAKARAAFSGVLGDHAQSAKNRAAAARGLARIDWLIDGNADAATTQLQEALTIGAEQCDTRIYLARVLRESGRFSDAVSAARDLSSCIERPNRDELLTERAHASLALNDLADAERSLGPVSRVGALAPPVNALKLQAALLQGRSAAALFGMARLFLVELFPTPLRPSRRSRYARSFFPARVAAHRHLLNAGCSISSSARASTRLPKALRLAAS